MPSVLFGYWHIFNAAGSIQFISDDYPREITFVGFIASNDETD